MDRLTYDAELRALAVMIATEEEMDANLVDKVARLFGTITTTANEDMCELVGLVVVDAMKALREYGRTTAASVAAE